MNIIDTLLSYAGDFDSVEDRNLCKSQIIELLKNYADGTVDHFNSFKNLSLIYIHWRGNNDAWFKTFDASRYANIKEKFEEYIFLIQDEENRLAHEEERMETRLALECGELDMGQDNFDDYMFLMEDEENRLAHDEERMETRLALEYGELDIGQ